MSSLRDTLKAALFVALAGISWYPPLLAADAAAVASGAPSASLIESARSGDSEGMLELGRIYLEGRGVATDTGRAAGWLLAAARLDQPEAAFRLAELFLTGNGVPYDPDTAEEYFSLAGQDMKWFDTAERKRFYITADEVKTRKTLAEEALRKAAGRGDTTAQRRLGEWLRMHDEGNGNKAAEGVMWLEKAAQAGNAEAQCLLSDTLRDGIGGRQDAAKAKMWLEKAAGAGNARACNRLHDTGFLLDEAGQQARLASVPVCWVDMSWNTPHIDLRSQPSRSELVKMLAVKAETASGEAGAFLTPAEADLPASCPLLTVKGAFPGTTGNITVRGEDASMPAAEITGLPEGIEHAIVIKPGVKMPTGLLRPAAHATPTIGLDAFMSRFRTDLVAAVEDDWKPMVSALGMRPEMFTIATGTFFPGAAHLVIFSSSLPDVTGMEEDIRSKFVSAVAVTASDGAVLGWLTTPDVSLSRTLTAFLIDADSDGIDEIIFNNMYYEGEYWFWADWNGKTFEQTEIGGSGL